MLHFKVKELILANGYPRPIQWLIKQCGLPKGRAYKLLSGKQKSINLDDFTMICKVMDCSPNELLYWKQTPRHTLPEGHSCLTKLTPPDGYEDVNAVLNKMSQDDIADVKKYMLSKIKDK